MQLPSLNAEELLIRLDERVRGVGEKMDSLVSGMLLKADKTDVDRLRHTVEEFRAELEQTVSQEDADKLGDKVTVLHDRLGRVSFILWGLGIIASGAFALAVAIIGGVATHFKL